MVMPFMWRYSTFLSIQVQYIWKRKGLEVRLNRMPGCINAIFLQKGKSGLYKKRSGVAGRFFSFLHYRKGMFSFFILRLMVDSSTSSAEATCFKVLNLFRAMVINWRSTSSTAVFSGVRL